MNRGIAPILMIVACWGLCGSAALAQDQFPSKAVTLVVPYATGGATDVMANVSRLPSQDGRAHVKSRVRFTTPAGPMQCAARWMADTDGAVFRIAASGGTWIPQESLLLDAEQALSSLRRLDPPAPAPEPTLKDAVKPKRTWWPFS